MEEKVTLFVLTYKRLWALQRFVTSVQEHTTYPHQIIVIVDGNDIESYQWAVDNNLNTTLVSWQREFVAQANLGSFMSDTELFCFFNDDMTATQNGWLSSAVEMFNTKFPDGKGLLSFDDSVQPEGIVATCGLISKTFVKTVYDNTLFYPKYKHYYSDKELTLIAKKINCYCFSGIQFLHSHPCRDRAENDIVYTQSYDNYWDSDKALFNERQQKGFPV